jgi:16S rRNA (guanine527-N7)-methyltransferase
MTFDLKTTNKINKWFETRGLVVPVGFIEKAADYCELLTTWSEKMNLVSKTDLRSLVDRHVLDSLTPLEVVPSKGYLLDIGSGGGFPAIPIAIAKSNLKVTMVESRHKKVVFLRNVIKKLKLYNVRVWQGRVEQYKSKIIFDIVTIRAVNPNEKVINAARRLTGESGKIVYYNKLSGYRLL